MLDTVITVDTQNVQSPSDRDETEADAHDAPAANANIQDDHAAQDTAGWLQQVIQVTRLGGIVINSI